MVKTIELQCEIRLSNVFDWNQPNEWIDEIMGDKTWTSSVYDFLIRVIKQRGRLIHVKFAPGVLDFYLEWPVNKQGWQRKVRDWMEETRRELYEVSLYPKQIHGLHWHTIIDDFLCSYVAKNHHMYHIHSPYLYNWNPDVLNRKMQIKEPS
jgi:hypothetical protein